MDLFFIILGAVAAYLIGSFPTAVWYSKRYFGIDVRDYGSGNAGATNTFRVLGSRAGMVVLLIDVLKGFVATSLAWVLTYTHLVSYDEFMLEKLLFYKLIFGLLAVLGHIFPIYANFKGGKGVATLLGMMLCVNWAVTLICLGIFIIVLLLSQYVSLGSLLAALAFPLILLSPRFKPDDPVLTVFGFFMFIVIAITHKKNIIRLANGEESRTKISFKRQMKLYQD
ncbi:MAG: glycerol-3-phosphate 1-O-acyltransferase PlsY [Microscillaceae bacterium]|nr:glycerol-3-phosphate 1-O-acyltransferase PlsY [Microscillaceae bacterium]